LPWRSSCSLSAPWPVLGICLSKMGTEAHLMVTGASMGQTAPRAENAQRVERLVATLSQEAATLCPLTDPGDQDALNRCRSALFNDSYFKRSLARIVLWGRP